MTDMIELAVYNRDGKEIESLQVDEKAFGGRVRYPLLKQAIVMYHANKRIGTAATKSRGMVEGSTRKLYRQKGTGNARMGSVRTNLRKGGGVAFGKYARDFGKQMPRKQRQLARNSAILAKFKSLNVVVVDELSFASPKTKDFATVLRNLKIERSCLVTIPQLDMNVYKSRGTSPASKCCRWRN
jgi:large subunit ribosomal protein L4